MRPDSLSTDRPGEASAEFRIGVRSAPYLADHGFKDMLVLPGSLFVEMARCVDRELTGRLPRLVRNVVFRRPIILAAEDIGVRVDVREMGDGRVEYTFYEADAETGRGQTPARPGAARLEIDRSASPAPRAGRSALPIEALQAQARDVIDAERFYEASRQNGNHYGPSFQAVSSLWRGGGRSLAKLSVACEQGDLEGHGLHPSVLDSASQVLASFALETGKTFVLRSIETVELAAGRCPDTLWAEAELLPGTGQADGTSLVGNVRVFDQSGRPYLELSGVRFALLDRVDAPEETTAARFVIASNFTAEPVEDVLAFWGDHFGTPLRTEFAPYDQIFQQLLDPRSAFRKNRDGVNVILLALQEWAARDRHGSLIISEERAEQCFGDRTRYVLPNGLEIVHLNRYETDYLYREIFEDQSYLRHGIRLPEGATVVDIGANIGLFSLFVMSRCRNARIYAFEPAPAAYELLKANCEAYGTNVRLVNAGVSDRPKTATLTFYEKSSVFSGFHADESQDREAIQAVVRNMLKGEMPAEGAAVEEYVTELTADRLRRTTHECRMTSVSDIIRDNEIDGIDLLKIDAEKSESEIIESISDRDWPKIAQIVVEIHDPTYQAVRRLEGLLKAKGYRCVIEPQPLLERSGLFSLYAIRGEAAAESEPSEVLQAHRGLQGNVQAFCSALKAFTKQAASPLVLCLCPTTPAAEADADLKAALDDATQRLRSEAAAMPNVYTISSTSLRQRYPVEDYYDPHGHDLGHILYTPAGYTAIGTALFRTVFSLKRKPFKVIVLDCDNTLWKGVCGEGGPLGIEVSTPYRRLQEFMVDQANAGMLLCLCSRNNEKDVLDVFAQRPDMVLKREHLVSWRMNWGSKSANVKALAKELGVGLDSVIFVDDNPIDCADVKSNCPGVLTLQLPRNSESLPVFLDHVWAFDHAGATEEDRSRTRMYRENAERQKAREQTCSLKDFIKGLELRVEIRGATDDELARVSQLTFRTNQFNFTGVRRSEGEITDFLKREHAGCLVVRVADRFGDYGLVGVVLYETKPDRYKVDTFLLSCRVLGRGVEHTVLSELGRRALGEHKDLVELAYRPTERNAPVRELMDRIAEQDPGETCKSWTFAAQRLASLEYDPDEAAQRGPDSPATPVPEIQQGWGIGGDRSEPLQRIGERLHDVDRIVEAIEERRLGKKQSEAPLDVAAGSSLQTTLLGIWRRVLGRPRIGMDDNFFEVGGTSLKAVQVIAMIRKELKRTLSIVSLFECPTVRLLAARLRGVSGEADGEAGAAEAARRGQRRRKATRSQVA